MDVVELEVVTITTLLTASHTIHTCLEAECIFRSGVAVRTRDCTIVLACDRRPLLCIIVGLLHEVSPTATSVVWHFLSIVNVADGSLQTNVVRLGNLPVLHEVGSNRTCAPSLTERECIFYVLTATNTEVKGKAVRVSDSGVPRSLLVKLDGEHRLRVNAIVVFHPSESLTRNVRIVVDGLLVGVSPNITEVIYKRVTGIVNTVVDISDNILLCQSCSVWKLY